MRKFFKLTLEKWIQKEEKKPEILLEANKNESESPLNINIPIQKEKPSFTFLQTQNDKDTRKARDLMNLMDTPFLALSKNRKTPIIYESPDGTRKVNISAHSKSFIASIYDWDIILFVAGRIQEILNNGSDIPARTLTFQRHEILKALHKTNINTQQKQLENSLHRLKRTAIDTTICNENGRYKSDFGFIDSWEYTERKDVKEIKITLSQWLYDLICMKGALLKVNPAYFQITSGLKKFLYRTARKHAGNNKEWEFLIKKLYEKSGSEQEFKKFKSDLKKAVFDNDLPEYSIQWIEKEGKAFVLFKNISSNKEIKHENVS